MYSFTSTWRWGAWIPVIIGGIGFILVFLSYHPPRRINAMEKNAKEVAAVIDYIGGVLSISGIALFMLGLQWAGYN